ncbi:MAG: alpha/beta fold hydrolase [Desulfobacteraceae bacterium]|nr:MAG: alpha/beta fold hydrolase [Desulfobacteraceae bacterium]
MHHHSIISPQFAHLYPYKSNYLRVNGLRYHYLDEGRGEPLLMLHGNPTWSFYFRNLVAAFKQSYRVIVPDHMGCGLSDKPDLNQYDFRLASRIGDLAALIEHLNPDRPVTLIAHDWGGMIGLGWALNHPERVARMVLMNTAGFFPPRGKPIPRRLRWLRNPNPIAQWAVLHLNLFACAALYMAPHRALPAEVRSGLIAPYNCALHRLATLKFVQDIPLNEADASGRIVARVEENLPRLTRNPVLLVWGAHDFVFDRAYFDEWRRRVPHAQAHWLTEAGHYLLEDAPVKIAGLIREFLNIHPLQ